VLPIVEVKSGKPIAINGAAEYLSIYRVEGEEPLKINAAFAANSNVYVGGGAGSIEFTGDQTGGSGKFYINSTGTTTFVQGVKFTDGASIAGDVVFRKKAEIAGTTNGVSFGGDVTLWHGLTADAASHGITITSGPVTLAEGKTIYVGGDVYTGGVVDLTPIVKATAEVELKTTGTTLTSPVAKYDEKNILAAKKLIVGVQPLTISAGTLEVVSGGTLTAGANISLPKAPPLSPTRAESPYLAVADGGTLALAAANTITIGDAVTIAYPTGTADATIKAAGGAVTFGYDEITGTDVTLDVAGAAVITVPGSGKTLRLSGVNLNLAAAGTLVITGDSTASRVVLLNKGKITLDTKTSVANTRTKLNDGTVEVTFTGIGAEALGASEKANANLISLAAPATGTVTITGHASSDFGFAKGKVKFVEE
jgi:hypothetical protein